MRDGERPLEKRLHGSDDIPIIRFAVLVVHDVTIRRDAARSAV